MVLKYGFLNYDEPKASTEETPKNLFDFVVKHPSDYRSEACKLAESVYENLNGKEKFRFYIISERGNKSVYQVNFRSETRDFFEMELADDLKSLCN